MQLQLIPASHIDLAWKQGANCLAEAADVSGGEITPSQLKLILSRGERTLVKMIDGDTVGWGVVRVDQLPNFRVLFVTDMVAHNASFERFFGELKKLAESLGCSRIRCAAGPAQARLYAMKCKFKPVYQILEVEV